MRTKNKFKILLLFVFYCIGSSTIEEDEKEEEINTPKNSDSNVEENRLSNYEFPDHLNLENKFNVPKPQPNMFMRTLSIFDDENLDNKATIKIEEKQVEKQNVKPSHSNSQKKKDRKQIKIINIPTAIKAFETFLENNMEIYYEINDKKDILFKEAIEILPNWDMNNIIKEIKNLYNKIENEKNNNENLKEELIEKLSLFILSPQTLENVNKITLKLVQNYISKNDRKTVQNPNFNENEIEIQLLSGELQQYRKNTNVILSKIVEYLKNYPTDYFNLYSSFLTVSNDYSEIITNYKNKYNKLKEQFNNILKGFVKNLVANNPDFLQCVIEKIKVKENNCNGEQPQYWTLPTDEDYRIFFKEGIDVTGMETFPKLRAELLKKLNKLKDIKFVESIKKTKEEFISDLILKEIKIEETLKENINYFEKINKEKEMEILNKIKASPSKLAEILLELMKAENTLKNISKGKQNLLCIKTLITIGVENKEEIVKIIKEMLKPEIKGENTEKNVLKEFDETKDKILNFMLEYIELKKKNKLEIKALKNKLEIEDDIIEILETLLEGEKHINVTEKKIKTLSNMLNFLNDYNFAVNSIASHINLELRKELEEITKKYKKLNLYFKLNNSIEKLYKSSYRLALSSEKELKSLEKINEQRDELNKLIIKYKITKENLNDQISTIKEGNGLNNKLEKQGNLNGEVNFVSYLNKINELEGDLIKKVKEIKGNEVRKGKKVERGLIKLNKLKKRLNKVKQVEEELNKLEELKKYLDESNNYYKNIILISLKIIKEEKIQKRSFDIKENNTSLQSLQNTNLNSNCFTNLNSSQTSLLNLKETTPSLINSSKENTSSSSRFNIIGRIKNRSQRKSRDFVFDKIEVENFGQEEYCNYTKIIKTVIENKERVFRVFKDIQKITENEVDGEEDFENLKEDVYSKDNFEEMASLLKQLLLE